MRLILASPLAVLPLLSACRENAAAGLSGTTSGTLEALARKRIFFGHQSIGAEILAGIRKHLTEEGGSLRIIPAKGIPPQGGFLAHAYIGRNNDPHSKLADFAARLDAMDEGVEIAVFKFCCQDVGAGIDAEPLFFTYRQVMDQLARRHPHVRLVHCTVPLTRRQSGPKAWLKRLLGRPVTGVEDNLVRARFNDLLRRAYGAAVFDLAAAESTWPDGHREVVVRGDTAGYALVPAYAEGDDHLNALGRRTLADRFLTFLATSR